MTRSILRLLTQPLGVLANRALTLPAIRAAG
jgi:hypothetical protein